MDMPLRPLPSPAASLVDGCDQAAADAPYYRGVLHELIELGMGLAREIAAAPVGVSLPEKARAFDLVSRAVRRTVRLAESLAKPGRARAGEVREPELADERTIEARRAAWDSCVERYVGGMEDEMLDRLEAPEVLEAIDRGRPIDEVIDEIRRDLGMATAAGGWRPPVTMTTREAWAVLEANTVAGGRTAADMADRDTS